MSMKTLLVGDCKDKVGGLLAISCKHNNVPDKNGKCHSTTCMMNVDNEIKKKISKEGCSIWTGLQKT